MSDWLVGLTGTEEGHRLALGLALMAAFLHALFGALQKGRHDPWLARAAIDVFYGVFALALVLFVVPWPEPHMWPIFAGAFVIHAGYKVAQALAYDRAPYTVVYPIARGTGPLLTVLAAGAVFGETLAAGQWLGLLALAGGILGLGIWNMAHLEHGRLLGPALLLALLTGAFVAAYTTYDAWGIRATADPFTFLAWYFLVDSLFIPIVTFRRWRHLTPAQAGPLLARGVLGALIAYMSFGGIMLATRIDEVGQAAALRETSVVFAALIGWWVLGEKTGRVQLGLMALIAAGAVMMEIGG